ncbi:hypothetical protein X975_18450, partial [Stegodyphus mimosarum]
MVEMVSFYLLVFYHYESSHGTFLLVFVIHTGVIHQVQPQLLQHPVYLQIQRKQILVGCEQSKHFEVVQICQILLQCHLW